MAEAFIINSHGDSSVLKLQKIKVPDPDIGEVQIEHTAIGVNHFDIHYRNGLYDPGALPAILGGEACGVVTKVGANTKNVKVGDQVVYGTGVMGAYSTLRNIPEQFVLPISNGVEAFASLAVCTKGLMAYALLAQAVYLPKDAVVLIHGVTGGVGHILAQLAKLVQAKIIGTVDSDSKIEFAKQIGCDLVVNTKKESFSKAALEFTDGIGVNAVYDCLGKKAFKANVKSVRPTGALVCYGDVLGVVNKINLMEFWENPSP